MLSRLLWTTCLGSQLGRTDSMAIRWSKNLDFLAAKGQEATAGVSKKGLKEPGGHLDQID